MDTINKKTGELVKGCSLEQVVADTLDAVGVAWIDENHNEAHLDFYLPGYDVYIEVKSGHSDRIATQTSRAQNVIVLQGAKATGLFCMLVKGKIVD